MINEYEFWFIDSTDVMEQIDPPMKWKLNWIESEWGIELPWEGFPSIEVSTAHPAKAKIVT
mgnify:CR=1 FL=1